MTQIEEIEQIGTEAVKKLRAKKLENGHPFMINSNDLPGYQCYLEYPDGSISLVAMVKSTRSFTLIRKLSADEANSIREKFHLKLS